MSGVYIFARVGRNFFVHSAAWCQDSGVGQM